MTRAPLSKADEQWCCCYGIRVAINPSVKARRLPLKQGRCNDRKAWTEYLMRWVLLLCQYFKQTFNLMLFVI